MNIPVEPLAPAQQSASEPSLDLDQPADRRGDVEAKQTRVADLLQQAGCEGLLLLEPENFSWLTSGALPRCVLDQAEQPALYFTADQRWLLSSNVDSQRLFDEELDELGFQLKEWPWHWGRRQLLADLCQGRRVACDRPAGDLKVVADELKKQRRVLTEYEAACCYALGQTLSHALEATCRTMHPGETERELAGHLSHRLLHRGALPLMIGVAADGRSRLYRQFSFTSMQVKQSCVMTATARKYGLTVTASRSACFGPPDEQTRQEHDAACKVSATYLASTWPDGRPRDIFQTGRRVYQLTGFEHEWLAAPQGYLTGRAAVEMQLTPATEDLFVPGFAVTWRPSVGAALSCDTFLVTETGPRLATPTEVWPLKKIRIQGADFVRPDLLQR
jgi:Xaa-Pro aminopeptidase